MYCAQLAERYPDPQIMAQELDDYLMYLGRYAHQDVDRLSRTRSVVQLMRWADTVGRFIREENEAHKG